MPTVSVIVLGLALAAGDPLSEAELDVAASALQEHLSVRRSLDVTYRKTYEWAPEVKMRSDELAPPVQVHWVYQDGKVFFSESFLSTHKRRICWAYDGKMTQTMQYRPGSGELEQTWVDPHPPRRELLMDNALAATLGFQTLHQKDGLLRLLEAAVSKKTLSGTKRQQEIELQLGTSEGYDFSVVLDAANAYRLTSWTMRSPMDIAMYGQQIAAVWRYVVDEFQEVADESTGRRHWFPRRAHNQTPMNVTRIEVESVRVGLKLSPDRLAPPKPPLGTTIYELPSVAWREPRMTIAGGEEGLQHRLDALAEKSKQELERLEKEGVTYDATPRPTQWTLLWWTLAAVFFGLACGRRVFRRAE